MQVTTFARRELKLVFRSPGFRLTGLLLAGVMTLLVLLPAVAFDDPAPDLGAAFLLGPATDILLPLIAIVFGHVAIVGRRETGAINGLLGMPYTRADIIYGAALGRSMAIAGMSIAAAVPAVIAITVVYGIPPIGSVLAFTVTTAVAGGVYTTVSVGVSGIVRTRIRALGALLAGFVIAHALWDGIVDGVVSLVEGANTDPWWARVARETNPLGAYGRLADAVLPAAPHVDLAVEGGDVAAEQGELVGVDPTAGDVVIPVLVLVIWLVAFLALARWRFARVDLK